MFISFCGIIEVVGAKWVLRTQYSVLSSEQGPNVDFFQCFQCHGYGLHHSKQQGDEITCQIPLELRFQLIQWNRYGEVERQIRSGNWHRSGK